MKNTPILFVLVLNSCIFCIVYN